jgi:hypothetical protein
MSGCSIHDDGTFFDNPQLQPQLEAIHLPQQSEAQIDKLFNLEQKWTIGGNNKTT